MVAGGQPGRGPGRKFASLVSSKSPSHMLVECNYLPLIRWLQEASLGSPGRKLASLVFSKSLSHARGVYLSSFNKMVAGGQPGRSREEICFSGVPRVPITCPWSVSIFPSANNSIVPSHFSYKQSNLYLSSTNLPDNGGEKGLGPNHQKDLSEVDGRDGSGFLIQGDLGQTVADVFPPMSIPSVPELEIEGRRFRGCGKGSLGQPGIYKIRSWLLTATR